VHAGVHIGAIVFNEQLRCRERRRLARRQITGDQIIVIAIRSIRGLTVAAGEGHEGNDGDSEIFVKL
jgi:hypothetical protein